MSRILLVEDNPHIMRINEEALTLYGYEIVKADSVAACWEALRWHPIDLVVLDILLPDGSGLDLCRAIKERYHVPILFLSALGESRDVVEGLLAGGDDYMAKPYDLAELAARIQARLRQEKERARYVVYGSLRLDVLTGSGSLDGEDLGLTQKEFSVLLLLARRAEQVVPKEEVLRAAWSGETDDRTLWTLISRLRKKLARADTRLEISSRRGNGYTLEQI